MYDSNKTRLFVHELGHRFPRMGDPLYNDIAAHMTDIVYGKVQYPEPALAAASAEDGTANAVAE